MSKYHSYYTDSHDIDCFFRIGNVAYHFASNGHKIPDFITREKNLSIQQAVNEAIEHNSNAGPVRKEVTIQDNNIKELISRENKLKDLSHFELIDERLTIAEMINDYALTFKEMAAIGFVSMDLNEDGNFYVIAKSQNPVPDDILRMLPTADDSIREKIKDN